MVGAGGCEQPFALRAPVHSLLPILVYCTETLRHRHTPESAFPGPGFLQTPEKAPQFTADIVTHSDLPRS